MRNKAVLFLFFMVLAHHVAAQRGLLDILEEEQRGIPQYSLGTFKATRIAIGHSVETRQKGILEIMLNNRYCNTPTVYSQSMGPEKLNTRLALEYGIDDRLSAGLGGSTWNGLFDGYLKYKLVRQRSDGGGSPLSVTLLQGGSYFSETLGPYVDGDFSNRMSYTTQVLIARKFSPNFSFQLVPTLVHKGIRYSEDDPGSHFAIGIGGRYKLGAHVALVSEYYAVLNPIESYETYGPLGIGVNWEVGNVMLQFMVTNATQFVEDAFITGTDYNFNLRNSTINFGLSATYSIHLSKELKGLGRRP